MNLQQSLGWSSLAAVLVLAGCAQPVRRDSTSTGAPAMEESTRQGDRVAPESRRMDTPRPAPRRARPEPVSEEMPMTPAEPARESAGEIRPTGSLTGVPVCDRYLASFKQCQTSIGQSSPAQVDERYDRLRQTLTSKSGTPEGRAWISQQCKQFAASVAEALDGRKCGDPPR